MPFRLSFGIGPLRYSTPLTRRRRRRSTASNGEFAKIIGYLIAGVFLLAAIAVGLVVFAVSLVVALIAGALVGLFAKPRTPGITAKRYAKAVIDKFPKKRSAA
jgi:hypothetical protein